MTHANVRLGSVALVVLALAACTNSTAPSPTTILVQLNHWSTQGLTNYTYVYEETGYFICCAEGKEITLTVRNDSVVAAMITATGQSVPPAGFPTIDGLFDRALAAERAGKLALIEFDPTFGYPVRMDFSGPPDASGLVFASHLASAP